jgi:UDP-N-acetyl-D-mannosaminuronic acid transferase (WecB/TagA/CpsF family)
VAEGVADQIAARWPGLRVAGLRHGYFCAAEEGDVVAQVRDSGADLLLVARGVPSQDLCIDRHLPLLAVKVAMGVGGLFDFASGRIARAPMWMRETGLEWAYRLLQEPGRMWRRSCWATCRSWPAWACSASASAALRPTTWRRCCRWAARRSSNTCWTSWPRRPSSTWTSC